jgi:hypothetical protein
MSSRRVVGTRAVAQERAAVRALIFETMRALASASREARKGQWAAELEAAEVNPHVSKYENESARRGALGSARFCAGAFALSVRALRFNAALLRSVKTLQGKHT